MHAGQDQGSMAGARAGDAARGHRG